MNLTGKSRGNIALACEQVPETGFQEIKEIWRETVGNSGKGMTHELKHSTEKLHIIGLYFITHNLFTC